MRKRTKLLIISIGVAVLGVLAFAGIALAADPTPPTTPPEQGWYGCGGMGGGVFWSDEVTKLLGLTPEQIQAQLREGKSLAQIAAARGVTEDALVAAILAPRKELMQQNVAAGFMTQAQVDQMLRFMEQNIRAAIKQTNTSQANGGAYGFGPGMMGGGMMGGWGGQANPGTGNAPGYGPRGMMGGWGGQTNPTNPGTGYTPGYGPRGGMMGGWGRY